MGVHGLWKLIESSGKPIPLETLENKVLAVDVSIWLHQAIKGFQDHKGAPVPNAHLLGIYHRVCKLLYFKIKPIFVFDGGVPALKRQTIAKRNQYKSKNASEADRLQRQLLSTLLKHTAISKVLSEKTKASLPVIKKSSGKYDNLYAPPTAEFEPTLSSSDDELEESSENTTSDSSPSKQWDLHTIDTTSHYFKSLPLEVKHDILTDLKETRKQNSWGKLHQLPKQSDEFSSYQMKRLLKRKEVQSALDEVSKEMGGMSLSLAELESLLKDQGIKTTNDSNIGKRIVSDDTTRYLYIKDIHEEIKKAEKADSEKKDIEDIVSVDKEEDEELKKAIQLSLEDVPSTSSVGEPETKKKTRADMEEEEELHMAIQLSLGQDLSIQDKKSKFSFLESFNDEDFQSDSDEEFEEPTPKTKRKLDRKMSSAQNYMMEYSGLTPAEIDKILGGNKKIPAKQTFKNLKLNQINSNSIQEFEKEKTVTAPLDIVTEVIENKTEKSDQTVDMVESFKEKTTNIVDNLSESDIKDKIEVMSDSGDSEEGDLCAVEPDKHIEIVIDPNKIKQDDLDDLFDDIFDKKKADDQIDTSTDSLSKGKSELNTKIEDLVKNDYNKGIEKETTSEDLNRSKSENNSLGQENVNKLGDSLELDTSITSNISETIDDTKQENVDNAKPAIQLEENKTEIRGEENTENLSKDEQKISELTIEEMKQLKDNLQSERIDLLREKSNKERLANNITDQMYQEAQELLELFGVPYVIAPMEAEAQCAFLDEIELTSGTITDDSDIWLFGGKTVYKNFFNQSKYVMEFKSENIEHHFKLSRVQMILLALLVGSDYTTGIQGVGPVTALEILASFPPAETHEFSLSHNQLLSGLREFKSWYLKGKTGGPGRSVLKNKLKNVTFTDHFPNPQVVQAYLEPKIEDSTDPFSWGKPDITALTVFAKEKFGWTMKKTEEILNPVIKKLEETQNQKSIKDYFKTKFKVDSLDIEGKVSKRVKSALDRFGKTQDELISEEMVQLEKEKRRAIGKKASSTNSKSAKSKNTKKINTIDSDKHETVKNTDQSKREGKSGANKEDAVRLQNEVEAGTSGTNTNKKSRKRKDVNTCIELSETSHSKETIDTKIAVPRKITDKNKKSEVGLKTKTSRQKKESSSQSLSEGDSKSLDQLEAVKDYENLAVKLKNRRKRKNELMKIKIDDPTKKKPKIVPQTVTSLEHIPKELEEDDEIKILTATTSNSARIVTKMQSDVLKVLDEKPTPKKAVPIKNLHTKDLIHQRIKDKSDSLRNKIKAIEVYRKSKQGPGYVPKRKKPVVMPKEDAGLSEDSD